MSRINTLFQKIECLTKQDGQREFVSVFWNSENQIDIKNTDCYISLKNFLQKIFDAIDDVANELRNDDSILISIKNQKLLRICYQLITSLGMSPCLIPGLGVALLKRCSSSKILPSISLTDEQKYEMLVNCTDFLIRSYEVPILKNIIITLHLSDYLAALIQLAFAPLKKPGTYNNFVMTQQMYNKLLKERTKYVYIYEQLVTNCFQPTLMKELLVLQSVSNPSPPSFVKRLIVKEMSRRLISSGGLFSLIRCFIESYNIDTGYEWKKIDMICRIVSVKHGDCSEADYLNNICSQLTQILCLNNTHYLSTAVACTLALYEKYPQNGAVNGLIIDIFRNFHYDHLVATLNLPGTLLLTPKEIEHKINILHACTCTKLDWPIETMKPNLFVLFFIGSKCTRNEEMKTKVKDIILKCFEQLNKDDISSILKLFLFGKENNIHGIIVEEYDAGIGIKSTSCQDHKDEECLSYFINLFMAISDSRLVQNIFDGSLQILIELSKLRQKNTNKDLLLIEDENLEILNKIDHQYAIILQLLSEISALPKVIQTVKHNNATILKFIEYFVLEKYNSNEECATVALVLLSTILSNSNRDKDMDQRLSKLVPVLKRISEDKSSLNHILAKEALGLILPGIQQKIETPFEKAMANVFDNLLPVRAHGLMELTKLVDANDPESISKKHYIFCIFQEQLKDSDSYIYLSAINGLSSLCAHCTEDVLHVLCKEFLHASTERKDIGTHEHQDKLAELRMKIGDVIVKVTRKLGDMAIVHKTILLNTMLCACRDQDPLIRTSALSNLAEIVLVLHYKIGSIIYEMLHCIWSVIETDKAVECRRAAVMIITSLIKGLGKETLIQLKENLLPIYRTLKCLYRDEDEDSVVRLHAQLALDELNDVVNRLLFPELKLEKQIFVLDKPVDAFK